MRLSIVTPYGEIFNGNVKAVNLPGVEGDFGVLPGHCDLLSLLKVGVIEVEKEDASKEMIAINWGYVDVSAEKIDILANGAVAIAGNNDNEMSQAIENAKKLLEEATADSFMVSSVLSKIEASARQSL